MRVQWRRFALALQSEETYVAIILSTNADVGDDDERHHEHGRKPRFSYYNHKPWGPGYTVAT